MVPDAEQKIRFNFKGQPWPDVLEWFARISKLSFDWQELPGDYLNLRTQRSYTLDEARDLLNRHLLDRGFTLLLQGEVMTVVNIKKLDPSLVPRVSVEELPKRDAHEFVKVQFTLKNLLAEAAVEELKPMLSPNGKITPLKATNRIEAMDAAVNLKAIAEVLAEEQSQEGPKRLVREFRLKHTRAATVHELLKPLLGLDAPANPMAGMTPEQQQQMQMQMQQMQQQRGGPQPPGGAAGGPTKIRLVVNTRDNSILANAPADQMAIIAEAIETVDVPGARGGDLLQNLNRMQVYRLNSLDAEPLVKLLQELGDLDPETELKIDSKKRSIIAYASLADHMTIRMLVQKLDGNGRRFEVIRLRRLGADVVANTIQVMFGGEEKKPAQQRNPFYYDFQPFGMGGNKSDSDDPRKFKVEADTEYNRLLLWADELELAEVRKLLVKLGEIPPEGGDSRTTRVLDVQGEEAQEFLRRLKQSWPDVAPNKLQVAPEAEIVPEEEPARRAPRAAAKPATPRPAKATSAPPTDARNEKPRTVVPRKLIQPARMVTSDDELAQVDDEDLEVPDDTPVKPVPLDQGLPSTTEETEAPEAEMPADEAEEPETTRRGTAERPPVDVLLAPDGRLIIRSKDTQALDMLEEMSAELIPQRKDYKIIQLKYPSTWAYGVAANLKDFFDEKAKDEKNARGRTIIYDYGMMPQQSDSSPKKLSKRRPLKFISDSDTNSILVVGADAEQMKIIDDLVAIYDQPPAHETKSERLTKLVTLKHARAKAVMEAVKDVYRDLLSSNDKALAGGPQKQEDKRPAGDNYTFIYGGGDDEKPETPIKFKGLLSIGMDELSNTLIISASERLLENVMETIESLDRVAQPRSTSMQVLRLSGKVDSTSLQQKLQKLMGKPPLVPGQPGQPGQPMRQQEPQEQQVGFGGGQ